MAPRANWKGYLRLSLVSCPIAVSRDDMVRGYEVAKGRYKYGESM